MCDHSLHSNVAHPLPSPMMIKYSMALITHLVPNFSNELCYSVYLYSLLNFINIEVISLHRDFGNLKTLILKFGTMQITTFNKTSFFFCRSYLFFRLLILYQTRSLILIKELYLDFSTILSPNIFFFATTREAPTT